MEISGPEVWNWDAGWLQSRFHCMEISGPRGENGDWGCWLSNPIFIPMNRSQRYNGAGMLAVQSNFLYMMFSGLGPGRGKGPIS
jgi:hypothetical protein